MFSFVTCNLRLADWCHKFALAQMEFGENLNEDETLLVDRHSRRYEIL